MIDWSLIELAHGVYNFKDVWLYYKRLGWTTKPGPELGYDHYYIKPGKNPRHDVEGEDFFYGEAAIVRHGMNEKIFGEVPELYQQPVASTPSESRQSTPRRRTSTTKRDSLSESTCNSEGEFDDDASTSSSVKRATITPRRRLQQQQQMMSRSSSKEKQKRRRPGDHALDAISITSGSTGSCDEKSTTTLSLDSSDDDESDADFCVDIAANDDDDEEEEALESDSDDDSDDDDSGDSSSEEDSNDDDIVVVNAGILASKLKGNFQAKKKAPRPLLSTKKRKAGADSRGFKEESRHTAKKARSHGAAASDMKSESKLSARTSQYAPASKPSVPTSASSGKSKRKPATPRRLSVETEMAPATESRHPAPHMTRTTTPAAASGAAGAPARASSAPSSPRHSFLTPQSATASSRRQREVTPSTQDSQVYVEASSDPAPFEFDNVGFEPDPEDFDTSFEPTEQTESAKGNNGPSVVVSSAEIDDKSVHPVIPEAAAPQVSAVDASLVIVHLQLDDVRFPSQPGQTYRVKISSTKVPKQTTIWMEHVQTREQRYEICSACFPLIFSKGLTQ